MLFHSEQNTHLNLSILLHCTTSSIRQDLEIISSFVDLTKSKQSVGPLKTTLRKTEEGGREREREREREGEGGREGDDFFLHPGTFVMHTKTWLSLHLC